MKEKTSKKVASVHGITRVRAQSVAELHPLSQLRFIRPPLNTSLSHMNNEENELLYNEDSIDSAELANIEIVEDYEQDEMEMEQQNYEDSDYEDEHNARFYDSSMSSSLASSPSSSSSSTNFLGNFLNPSFSETSGLLGNDEEAKQSKTPFMRYGHTVVAYMGKAYLWGGRNDVHGSSDVLHEYNPSMFFYKIS